MKLLFDLLPLLVFFAAFKFYDIYTATAAAILATFVQVGLFWARHRRFETIHLVTLGLLSVFGGLTIALQDDVFIKWKPSIVNWVFTVAIGGTLIFGKKSALEHIMGRKFSLSALAWRKLNVMWAAFFLLLGLLNWYVAFHYNSTSDEATRTETWVNFKVFGMTGLTFAFVVLQMFFLAKHITPDESEEKT